MSRLARVGRAAPPQGKSSPATSPLRRFKRRLLQRLATLGALLILFYATSLHGLSLRTLLLTALLVLCLYWLFHDRL